MMELEQENGEPVRRSVCCGCRNKGTPEGKKKEKAKNSKARQKEMKSTYKMAQAKLWYARGLQKKQTLAEQTELLLNELAGVRVENSNSKEESLFVDASAKKGAVYLHPQASKPSESKHRLPPLENDVSLLPGSPQVN
jgi:hypothetical protein